jgi:predicted nucleotidyltransferase
MAIQSLPISRLGVEEVYGFGSFFRGEAFHDIDLVLVVSPDVAGSVALFYELKEKFDQLAASLGAAFDLTVLTRKEFNERPLRDMDQLVRLYTRA